MRDVLIKTALVVAVVTFNHIIRPHLRKYFTYTYPEPNPEPTISPKASSNLTKVETFNEIFPGKSTSENLFKSFIKVTRTAIVRDIVRIGGLGKYLAG